jgi:hypothetical protein
MGTNATWNCLIPVLSPKSSFMPHWKPFFILHAKLQVTHLIFMKLRLPVSNLHDFMDNFIIIKNYKHIIYIYILKIIIQKWVTTSSFLHVVWNKMEVISLSVGV